MVDPDKKEQWVQQDCPGLCINLDTGFKITFPSKVIAIYDRDDIESCEILEYDTTGQMICGTLTTNFDKLKDFLKNLE